MPELEKCDSYGVDFDGASTARQSRGTPRSLAALELALSLDDLIISDALLIKPAAQGFCVAREGFLHGSVLSDRSFLRLRYLISFISSDHLWSCSTAGPC